MRIIHILDRADAVGGVQTYLRQLVPGLARRGVASTVVTGSQGAIADAEMVRVAGVGIDAAVLPHEVLSALRRVVAEREPSLVLQHVAPSPSIVSALAPLAPVAVYAHDYFMSCPGNARYLHRSERFCDEGHGVRCLWRAYTERSTNRRPDRMVLALRRTTAWDGAWPSLLRVLVSSPFVADVHLRRGVPEPLVRVVGYPVNPQEPGPAATDGADVVYVGRVVGSKGVQILLRALAPLDGISAVIAGDGPARPALESLSARLGVGSRVRFLGWIDSRRRTELFRAARMFVLPSLWDEPFGIVGLEALASGLPVVAADTGGISSWLNEGVAGTLVPRGDVPALSAAIERLVADDELRARYAAAGPAAAARFGLAPHVEGLLAALELA